MPELDQEPFKPKFSPDELRKLEACLSYLVEGVRKDLDRIHSQYVGLSLVEERITALRRYLTPLVDHLDNPPQDTP